MRFKSTMFMLTEWWYVCRNIFGLSWSRVWYNTQFVLCKCIIHHYDVSPQITNTRAGCHSRPPLEVSEPFAVNQTLFDVLSGNYVSCVLNRTIIFCNGHKVDCSRRTCALQRLNWNSVYALMIDICFQATTLMTSTSCFRLLFISDRPFWCLRLIASC